MTNQTSFPATSTPQTGLSADTRAMMIFEANKKQNLVAYLLWFFVGFLGGHNFYLGRIGVAVAQLILTLTIIGIVITFFWVLVDAFLIPGWVRRQNNLLAAQLGARLGVPDGDEDAAERQAGQPVAEDEHHRDRGDNHARATLENPTLFGSHDRGAGRIGEDRGNWLA